MRKSRFMVAVAVMLSLFMCFDTAVVGAATLSQLRNDISQRQAELNKGQEEEASLAKQLGELEGKMLQLQAQISTGEEKLKTLEAELAEAQKKVDTQNDNLGNRLENMYKNGTVGFADVLLDSNSFSEFLTNLDLVEKIYSSDKEVLSELQEAHDAIETKKKEVETLQAELEKSKTVAEEQQESVSAKKAELAAENEETAQMIDEMQAEADAMTAKINASASSSSSSTYYGGVMAWPCPGYGTGWITSDFGNRWHPVYGGYKFHTGIDIGASGGTPIVAANSGKVILAGWNGGYGNCVVIDHGGGITTLYGHTRGLNVYRGQQVSRGQTIAWVGTTGTSTGNHLHFEVRVNGSYKNPLNYIT
ncbi:MAG: peptidoglycan DD-metalloendopeptidase family protein [Clostridiales bacterium]|nr:peptidoglycan DD-metalloendopeptidase family protein [Clostridiales bacterium]